MRNAFIGVVLVTLLAVAGIELTTQAEAAGWPFCWTLDPFNDTLATELGQPVPDTNFFVLDNVVWNGISYVLRGGGVGMIDGRGQSADFQLTMYHNTSFFGGNHVCTFSAHLHPDATGEWGVVCPRSGSINSTLYHAGGLMFPRDCANTMTD
jgi:hypothetical protein